MAWNAPLDPWRDPVDDEPESLGDLLASEYGVDPTELEESELFEAFMDAMEAEAWDATGRRRSVH